MRKFRFVIIVRLLLSLLVICTTPRAMAQLAEPPKQATDDSRYPICEMIEIGGAGERARRLILLCSVDLAREPFSSRLRSDR